MIIPLWFFILRSFKMVIGSPLSLPLAISSITKFPSISIAIFSLFSTTLETVGLFLLGACSSQHFSMASRRFPAKIASPYRFRCSLLLLRCWALSILSLFMKPMFLELQISLSFSFTKHAFFIEVVVITPWADSRDDDGTVVLLH